MKPIYVWSIGFFFWVSLNSIGQELPDNQEYIKEKIQKLFDQAMQEENIHCASLSIYSPSQNLNHTYYGGQSKNREAMDSLTPFHSASVGKTFTALSIALLQEQDKLNFSDQIHLYLSEDIMKNLHVYDGVDYSSEIRISHLLQHTSGLADYFEDLTKDGSPNAMQLLFEDTARFWKPLDMINLYKNKMKPKFRPGMGYHYTDTEYILLGLIIEKVSGLELHEFFHQNIFIPLKLNNTSMHLRSQPLSATRKLAELYVNQFEISKAKSLSLDWAGGGISTTAKDLNIFHEALNSNGLVSSPTLKKMKKWTKESRGSYYGFGLRKIVLKELSEEYPEYTLIGHNGSTSAFMFYCPELDLYLSGTFNQTAQVKKTILFPIEILKLFKMKKK